MARQSTGIALALLLAADLLLDIQWPNHLPLLLHGGGSSIFRGSLVRVGKSLAEVVNLDATGSLWQLRNNKGCWYEKRENFQVDFYLCPNAASAGKPSQLRVVQTSCAGRALQTKVDLARGMTILQEPPFMVACDQADVLGSRWRAVNYARHGVKILRLLESFSELSTNGLELERTCLQQAYSISNQACDTATVEDIAFVPRASGIYKFHSFLQHSCEPNCAVGVLFSTGDVLVRALRRISAGEVLTRNCEKVF